ncbi:hypothetical protein QTQ03_00570 [Micromonospora sp. WMMA1363]|nr:hypothetical protein [Micromonospora sp. WMMA1363]MDM4718154.1 hypothetical protein [Micromonospora sp. WMMA1363]
MPVRNTALRRLLLSGRYQDLDPTAVAAGRAGVLRRRALVATEPSGGWLG